jgi:hypothetical protein
VLTHVAPHFLVAVHAQTILRGAIETDMAFAALLLPLGMPLHEFARAQHRFEGLRVRRRRDQSKQQQE